MRICSIFMYTSSIMKPFIIWVHQILPYQKTYYFCETIKSSVIAALIGTFRIPHPLWHTNAIARMQRQNITKMKQFFHTTPHNSITAERI